MPPDTTSGGAATCRGIWYQALWCVLQATSARILRTPDSTCENDTDLQLVLEPSGGDALLERPDHRRVVQLKTRSSGTWSLKQVVEQVLPDLYRAVDLGDAGEASYEFVTEGGMGQWGQVCRFFESLGERFPARAPEAQFSKAYEGLDNTCQMTFGGSQGEFWKEGCTERAVFDRIVDHLRTKPGVDAAPIEETRRKAWHLLAGFRFTGDMGETQVRRNLDSLLLSVVDHRDRLPAIRDAMAGRLLDWSGKKDTTIRPDRLFEAVGLKNVLPVCIPVMSRRCGDIVRRRTQLLGYRSQWDVRHPENPADVDPFAAAPFVVITGESGHGKSWRLYANALSAGTVATVLLESTGSAQQDLQQAAHEVWQVALGHETPLPWQSLAARTADVLRGPRSRPWLRICLDRLTDVGEARALLATPVEDFGVRLVIACDPQTGAIFEQHERQQPGRVQMIRLDRFTPTERDTYLQRRLGDSWVGIPSDVRELLRAPKLADLYCELSGELEGWQPRSEYELLDRYWRRLTTGENTEHRRDAMRLQRLAASVIDGEEYPWTEEQLERFGIDEAGVLRINNAGWLRLNTDDRYEVPHDRLLSFAIAKELAARDRDGRLDGEALELLADILNGDAQVSRAWLGYVPMDWLCLRSKEDRAASSRVLAFLEDRLGYHHREEFYRRLLPTLEAAALPLLAERLIALAEAGRWWELQPVVDGLATRPPGELRDCILGLLKDARPLVQRAGLKLLSKRPIPEALDLAWQLHVRMQADPYSYGGDRKFPADAERHSLYADSFAALRECARICPRWIIGAIHRADPATEPVHDLAYLTAVLGDGGDAWRSTKVVLFAKVGTGHRRSLAVNIGVWRDSSELDWLEDSVRVEEDLLGPAALRALSQIDPHRTAVLLPQMPESLLYFCRGWYLPRLSLTAARAATHEALHQIIRQAANPLQAALVYQGNENEMDPRTLEFLLHVIDDKLELLLDEVTPASEEERLARRHRVDALYVPLSLLAAIGRGDLLDVFASQRGTSLEHRLQRLLTDVIGPRAGVGQDNLARDPALSLLLKIGCAGYRQVVNRFLDADNRYGKLQAIEAAMSDADTETLGKLRDITVSDELWDKHFVLQMQAMQALAAHGDGTGVMKAARHLGLNMPREIKGWLRQAVHLDSEAVAEATAIVRARDSQRLPGALAGLGLLGHVEALGDMMAVLQCPPTDDALRGAILGLGLLGEAAAPAIGLITRHFADTRFRYLAVEAMSRIGTAEARQHLFRSLGQWWDINLAMWLAHFPEVRDAVVDMLVTRLCAGREKAAGERMNDTEMFLAQATEDVLQQVLRRTPVLSDRIREAAFGDEGALWIVGSKARAVRGLAGLDPGAARHAALKALKNADAHDRQLYPALLRRLDPVVAREMFLGLAAEERHAGVLWAMAYSLVSEDTPWLLSQLAAESAEIRVASCRLAAGPVSSDQAVRNRLLELLDDPVDKVRGASEETLKLCRRQHQAEMLADEFEALGEAAGMRAWILLDAALQVGHGGYKDTEWPTWAKRFAHSAAVAAQPALGWMLNKRLDKMREESLKKANDKAKRRN